MQVFTAWQTVVLSFQSLGIVYGDLGTSPLYVLPSVVLPGADERDFLGILSLILWTLTLMSLVKYVVVVLRADDHGEGGTFAIYSLLRQHVNFKGTMPVQITRLASDLHLRFYSKKKKEPSWMQRLLERSTTLQSCVTYTVLLGTFLSAVQGIQSRSPKIEQKHVLMLTVVILLLLFLFQRLGTSRVSFSFSPIMLVWFGSISMIGLYNIIKYYPSPHYIYYYFARNGAAGWEQLGAIILCITGETDELAGIVARLARVPGVCFFFTDLMNGLPPIVRHYAEHTGCIRELLVFVTIRTLPVTSVLPEERFLVAAVDEVPAGVYRCVAQYGYMDKQAMEGDEFLESIVATLKDVAGGAGEAAMMDRARRNGVSVVIGRTILTASGRKHGWFKRFVINHLYRFLQKFECCHTEDGSRTLQVGNRYKIE
ncbi:hypothetical protein ACQ4PT_068951 [Festuca glaucescens]